MSNEKKLKEIREVINSKFDPSDFFNNKTSFQLKEDIDKFTEDYKDKDYKIFMTSNYNGYYTLHISYFREETDEEFNKRIKKKERRETNRNKKLEEEFLKCKNFYQKHKDKFE